MQEWSRRAPGALCRAGCGALGAQPLRTRVPPCRCRCSTSVRAVPLGASSAQAGLAGSVRSLVLP